MSFITLRVVLYDKDREANWEGMGVEKEMIEVGVVNMAIRPESIEMVIDRHEITTKGLVIDGCTVVINQQEMYDVADSTAEVLKAIRNESKKTR